ncbi:unnamed protein product [Soboliphyme baturini]|uniref:MADF domain-containing protein n=1 Tax=Soboliphyme baturini TaxID=241478 RepID=A0A183J3S2_9BILA|nr:unnamed protein product [Soboliphyme baturini]
MAKPSQLGLLNLVMQRLYTKALRDISIPDYVETRNCKASCSSKKAHFNSLYPDSKFFSDGPRLMCEKIWKKIQDHYNECSRTTPESRWKMASS